MIKLLRQYIALRRVNRLARRWRESAEGKRYIERREAAKRGWQRRKASHA